MRSHTGGKMSLGAGAVYATSIRQKLITKCSPEAELVAVDAEAIQEASPERRCQCHMCALNLSRLVHDDAVVVTPDMAWGQKTEKVTHATVHHHCHHVI
jgi:hypothetical protein